MVVTPPFRAYRYVGPRAPASTTSSWYPGGVTTDIPHFGFPTGPGLPPYPRRNHTLQSPCFGTEVQTPLTPRSVGLASDPPGAFRSCAYTRIALWFHALFTRIAAYFSSFPHGTWYAIGLRRYLGLPVSCPASSRPFTNGRYSPAACAYAISSTGLSPSEGRLSRRLRVSLQQPTAPTSPEGFRSACSVFDLLYWRNHYCFLFLPLL